MAQNSLKREIRAAERRLASLRKKASASRRPTASEVILAEIAQIEEKLACGEMGAPMEAPMSYMEMEESMDYMDYMDMDMDMDMDDDIIIEDDLDDDFDDEMSYMEMEEPMGYMHAADEGVEDEITQDYLSDVVNLMGKGDLATEPSMEDAARDASMTSVDFLKRASARLDRVSNYLEKNGQVKIAFRLDKMADAVDARIKQEGN